SRRSPGTSIRRCSQGADRTRHAVPAAPSPRATGPRRVAAHVDRRGPRRRGSADLTPLFASPRAVATPPRPTPAGRPSDDGGDPVPAAVAPRDARGRRRGGTRGGRGGVPGVVPQRHG